MNAKLLIFLAALPLAASADTILPSSGPDLSGTVTKYANGSFEVRMADGKMRTFSSTAVKRISFETRPIPTKVTLRTKGALEGKVTGFESGAFSFEGAAGAEKLPAIFVDQVNFGGNRGPAIDVITKGAQVDLTKHLAPGCVTIVDFYADWCGPCKQLSPTLERIAQTDPEVALRKIDIVDWSSAVSKQYHIQSIPHVEIYNRTGKLIGTVGGDAPEQVRKYVEQAKTGS